MIRVTFHRLFTAVLILIIAVNTTQNVMAVSASAAAFALPPSSVSNEIPGAIVDEVEEEIEWMDDWMLRFGGVARYAVLLTRRGIFSYSTGVHLPFIFSDCTQTRAM